MKVLNKAFQKDGAGSIKVVPEDSEDLWHLYNLIREGDSVTATTFRKVQRLDLHDHLVVYNARLKREAIVSVARGRGVADGERLAQAGNRPDSKETERVRVRLEIAVAAVEYDGDAEIRCKGRNQTENDHVPLGAYHTVTLEPNAAVALGKACWDKLDVQRLQEAANPAASADLAVVLLDDGLAHVCLVGRCSTLLRAKVQVPLPKKRGAGAAAGHADAWSRFMRRTYDAVKQHVDFGVVRCLLLAGPGFAKDRFREYLLAEAARAADKTLLQSKDRIIAAHASTAYLQGIEELLSSGGAADRIADTKAAREVRVLDEFFEMLAVDSARAFYGPGHVLAAAEHGAVAKLLLSDSLYKVHNVPERRRWVKLVESVEAAGGQVFLFSARHVSGQRLADCTGVAAILRFPMPELEDADPADLLAGLQL